jgi:hypothetical protein
MILLMELFAASLIAVGIFLLSVPIGLIFVGSVFLLFAFAIERGQRKASK